MTTLTLRRIKSDFVVAAPDILPASFKSRREAKGWCLVHYSGPPIREVGADGRSRRDNGPGLGKKANGPGR